MMRYLKYLSIFILTLFFIFLISDFLYPLDKDKLYRLQSKEIKSNNGELLRMGLSSDGFWRFDCKDSQIPQLLKKSVILFEDRYFYYHFGVNIFSIFRAILHNQKEKKIIGASTITMQVARMMQRRERNYKSKLIELFNALQLEWHFSKDEILLFYLNLAPYGGNIEGVKAASYFYFKKEPKDLSVAQIALLTTIPKNPNINRLDTNKNIYKKRKNILSKLYKNSIITKSQLLRANIEPIAKKRFLSPFYAPQYTNQALKTDKQNFPLDLNIQLFIENTLKKALLKLKNFNVKNGAAILIDNENMNVIAYVGSNNFKAKRGQNDGVRAIRSPGSTLKPFIYAKSLDLGLITPKQKLFDVPLHIGFYEPKNFNKSFFGLIRAEEALQYSLNIPAVELNRLLEYNSLYEMLVKAKINSIDKSKDFYGDGIALGGFGISLLDLTHLYTAFSNKGRVLPLNVAGKILDKNISLISNESAWIVSEILSEGIRPELSEFWESLNFPRIGFKTGTSANSKDLYTIGYTKKFTFGVWLGNFSGEKTSDLSGLDTASKIVFSLFRFLDEKKRLDWFEKPKKVLLKEICLDAIETNECKEMDKDFIIKGVAKNSSCKALRGEILTFLLDQNHIKSLKDFSKNRCYETWQNFKPVFISPYDKATFFMVNKRKVLLKCYSFCDDNRIYFKIDNGELIKAKSGEEVFVDLDYGTYELSCIDAQSRVVTNEIKIKDIL